MKYIVKIVLIFLSLEISAQVDYLQLVLKSDTSWQPKKVMLGLHSGFNVRSNVIPNEMLSKFIIGGEIADELIDETSDNLLASNRLGLQANAKLSFYNFADTLLGSSNWGLFLNIEQKVDAGTSFRKGLFNIVFKGNKNYSGRSAYLGASHFEFLQYQKMGIGVFNKKSLSGFALSYVNGQNAIRTAIEKGRLFTSSDGDSLSLDYQGNVMVSDTSKRTYFSGAGSGLAIDGNWNFMLPDASGFMIFSIANFGFVNWSDQSLHYEADSVYNYTGATIGNLYDAENFIEVPTPLDSISYSEKTSAEWMMLPARFQFSLMQKTRSGDFIGFSIAEMNREEFVTELNVSYHYLGVKNFLFSAEACYGGYGGFRLGAGAQWLHPKWFAQLELEDLIGTVNSSSRGRGISIGLSRFF
jgi:hypothetical protein